MKLGKCAVALVVTSFLLTGCQSSGKTVQEDGKYVVATLNNGKKDKNLFADDIFEDIISTTSGKGAFFDAVLEELINQKFPVDSDMETDADQTISQVKAYYEQQYGDSGETQLTSALSQSGYSSIDDYREDMIKVYQKCNFLLDYIENNFDEVFEDYYQQATPRYASIIKVSMTDVENPTSDEAAKMNEVTALLSTDKGFGSIATDYSDDTNTNKNKGKLGIVDTTSSITNTYGSDVETKIFALNKDEVSEPIKGEDGYYFVKVTSINKESIKKDIKKNLSIDTPLISYDDYLLYIAYKSYDVKYDDKDTKKIIDEVLEKSLAERETSRGGNQ